MISLENINVVFGRGTPLQKQALSKINLTIAKDRKFNNVVEERLVNARKDRGYTAKTFVNGLKPHEEYFYRFTT